jgi:hypothetical protein
MNIAAASTGDIYRWLLEIQDRVAELLGENRIKLESTAESAYRSERNAVSVVLDHLEAAMQVLAVLETTPRDVSP